MEQSGADFIRRVYTAPGAREEAKRAEVPAAEKKRAGDVRLLFRKRRSFPKGQNGICHPGSCLIELEGAANEPLVSFL